MADVEIEIGVDDKEAKKALSSLESALNGVKVVAGAALALFAGKQVVDFFGSAVDAAIEAEQSIQTLNTALKTSGDFTQEASLNFQNLASEIQSTTGVSEDLILEQIAIAKSFGLTNTEAESLIGAAVDLAAATGTTLDGAVQQLGKTYSGVTGKLDDQFIALKGLTKEQLANGEAVKVIGDRLKGTAKELTETFGGSLKRASTLGGELQETIGKLITQNPIIIKAISKFGDILDELNKFVESNKDAIDGFVTDALNLLVSAIGPVLDSIFFLIRAGEGLVTVFNIIKIGTVTLAEGFVFLGDTIATALINPFEKAIAAAYNLQSGVASLVKQFPSLSEGLKAVGIDVVAIETEAGNLADVFSEKAFNSTVFENARTKIGAINDEMTATAVATSEGFEKTNASIATFITSVTAGAAELTKVETTTTAIKDQEINLASEAEKTNAKVRERVSAIEAAAAAKEKEFDIDKFGLEAEKASRESINGYLEQQKKIEEEITKIRRDAFESGRNSPLIRPDQAEAIAQEIKLKFNLSVDQTAIAGQVTGFFQAALNGAEGAKSLVSSAFGTLADTLLPGLGGPIKDIFNILAGGPEKVKELIQGFVKALPTIITAVAESIPVVIIELAKAAPQIIQAIILGVPKIITELVKNAPQIITAIVEGLLKTIIPLNIDGQKLKEKLIQVFTEVGAKVKEIFTKVFSGIGDFLSDAGSGISDFFSSLGEDISSGFASASESAGAFFLDVGQGIQSAASSVAEFFDPAVTFIKNAAAKVVDTFKDVFDGLAVIVRAIFDPIKSVFESVAAGFFTIVTYLEDALNFLGDLGQSGIQAVSDFISFVGESFTKLGTFIFEGLVVVRDKIRQAFNFLGNAISSGFSAISEFVSDSLASINEFFAPVFETINSFFNVIGDGFDAAGERITAIFDKIGSVFTDALADLGNFGTNIYNSITGSIDNAFSNIGPFFKGLFTDIGTAIKGIFSLDFEGVKKGFSGIFTKIGDSLKAVLGFAVNPIIDFLNGLKIPDIPVPIKIGGKNFGFTIPGVDFIPGNIERLPGFAKGGTVPPGFPNDSFTANLQSDELVIPRDDVRDLREYLDANENGQLLIDMIKALEKSENRSLNVTLKVSEKDLANVMLNINRQGFRTVA